MSAAVKIAMSSFIPGFEIRIYYAGMVHGIVRLQYQIQNHRILKRIKMNNLRNFVKVRMACVFYKKYFKIKDGGKWQPMSTRVTHRIFSFLLP